MVFKTRITEMLGIEYPIIQGAIQWLSRAELVSAVSNAGGLGVISSLTFPTAKELQQEIKKTKSMTDKPFAVNVTMLPTLRPVNYEEYFTAAIIEGVNIIETSGRSPEPYMKLLKDAKVKVMHRATRVRDIRTAERVGVDAVTIVSFEAAGHPGMEDVTSMVRIPIAVDAVKIPVIAAGGIADARGLVAALALGAEGIYMGTRFLATYECNAHPTMKQAVIQAGDTSTIAFGRRTGISRCLKNAYTARHMEMEASGATFDELREYERSGDDLGGWRRIPAALVDGNITHGSAGCGAIAGMINEIISAGEVIRRMVEGYEAVLAKLR